MSKWLVAFASLLVLAGCDQPADQIHLSGPTMGTTYNIKYIEQDGLPKPDVLQAEIDRLLEEVNDQMSTYREDSELSRFNQHQTSEPFEVSPQTATVVKEAIRLNGLTLGALDVTVGPLVNLWGFGPEARLMWCLQMKNWQHAKRILAFIIFPLKVTRCQKTSRTYTWTYRLLRKVGGWM